MTERPLCAELSDGPEAAVAPTEILENFRVFVLDVAVDSRRVLKPQAPAEVADFRPRWWRAPCDGAE